MAKRVQKVFVKPSLTKQYFKDQCNATSIVKKFRQVNHVDLLNVPSERFGGTYIDCVDVPDYQGSFEQRKAALEAFNALPDKVRAYYGYDPVVFVNSFDPAHFEVKNEPSKA